ncbi:hypothetical protein LY10_03620 [Planktotalea frisia]|uniref:Uncharacterized protein n=1 Tax=Planktotalea frisia TaxID=696762 RepID=A0A1L9NR02_9RHOB|nr:hypothetical protein [Planktotalea frisia]OJI91740.1 hypothetical protein PFRI_40360 [Planktotalea frisia]PZX21308.1 hypothetical protein LY10_03620 [Planktotalea frisia]
MDFLLQIYQSVYTSFTDLNSRLAFFYLALTVLIVAFLWIMRGRPGSFVSYLLPKEVYLHKSNLVDIKIFLFNSFLSVLGLFTVVTMTPLILEILSVTLHERPRLSCL